MERAVEKQKEEQANMVNGVWTYHNAQRLTHDCSWAVKSNALFVCSLLSYNGSHLQSLISWSGSTVYTEHIAKF